MGLCGGKSVVGVAVLFLLLATSTVLKGASIDEIIMQAAPRSSALDTFQMSPEGNVMVLVELDIQMDIQQYMELKEEPHVTRGKRKAVRAKDYRWKNCYVYYEIDMNYFDQDDVVVLKAAMAEWEKYTCLSFKNDTSRSEDKVIFQRGTGGCYSRLGRVGGTQHIGLAKGCVQIGVVVHEIGHAIGWIHEQARPDRDKYIKVNFNRIPQSWHGQFDKFTRALINDYGVEYDYRSIMHYSGNAVAPMSIQTLNPKFQSVIGQREGLSFRDVMLANLMYECANMLCSGVRTNCSKFGSDAFLFMPKRDSRCQCFCDGSSVGEVLIPCESSKITTTRTPSTTTVPAKTTTLEPEPMECLDQRDDCAKLAASGECKMDMERMFVLCKKSCNFCKKEGMCMDYDPSCPLLALGNFCDHPGFESIMKMNCKKSCQICTPIDPCAMQLAMGLSDNTSGSGQFRSSSVTGLLVLVCVIRQWAPLNRILMYR